MAATVPVATSAIMPSSNQSNLISFSSSSRRRPYPTAWNPHRLPQTFRLFSPKPSKLLTLPLNKTLTIRNSSYDGAILLDDKPKEECGVVGIFGDPNASHLCSLALLALQHRGQEGAGIASVNDGKIESVVGLGLVRDVLDRSSKLDSLLGSSAIGHVRYSTAGAKSVLNVQPFVAGYRFGTVAIAHNGNFTNYRKLHAMLENRGSIFKSSSDTEVVVHLIATSKSRPFTASLVEACEQLEGAYSLVFVTQNNRMFAVRDPYGFRPLVIGQRDNNSIVFASETCALDLIGAKYLREVHPGEIVIVEENLQNPNSPPILLSSMYLPSITQNPKPRRACVFEHIYFAQPNSIVFGRAVHKSRQKFGAKLALESPVPNADIVIPVPDSGTFAALGFAQSSGIPFQQGLIRSHYIGRTFIQPTQEIRDLSVRLKLAPVHNILNGKIVVVIDDSIVRGTTSKKIIRLIKDAGAKEVHMRIACPPMVDSCYYGVDTPDPSELISNVMDLEMVREFIGADSLAFLSLDRLKESFEDDADEYCDACLSRNYPVLPKLEDEEDDEEKIVEIINEVEVVTV